MHKPDSVEADAEALKVELSLAGTAEVREAAEVAGSEVLSHFAVPPRPKSWLDHCHAEFQL